MDKLLEILLSKNLALILTVFGVIFIFLGLLKKTKYWERDPEIKGKPLIIIGIILLLASFTVYLELWEKLSTKPEIDIVENVHVLSCKRYDNSRIDQVVSVLNDEGINSSKSYELPPLESCENNPYQSIRYFSDKDKATAEAIRQLIQGQTGIDIEIRNMEDFFTPKKLEGLNNQYEVWLN